MLKTERNAKNFQMACNQHIGSVGTNGDLEIINLFSAFYVVVSKRFRNFASDITKRQAENPLLHKMEDFIHLHVHTYYSILDGQSKIQNLVMI